ncbi:hypothetical protein F2Q68_00008303 [Brassica cretica]|uniref:Uncharacterized protein n=1 Tax=Brassica cretica TaxID=69181 RepID=A0A8S9KZI8_BRACR|nr:hypothetical protein F2Q68_00008303 [Brassica cretica]
MDVGRPSSGCLIAKIRGKYHLLCRSGMEPYGEVLGSSNAKRTNNLPVDVEAFPPTVRALQGTDPNPSPWEETPPHPPVGSVPCRAVSMGSTGSVGSTGQVVTKKIYFFYVTTHPAHSEPGSQPWEKTPPHPPVSRSIGDNSSCGSVVKE